MKSVILGYAVVYGFDIVFLEFLLMFYHLARTLIVEAHGECGEHKRVRRVEFLGVCE